MTLHFFRRPCTLGRLVADGGEAAFVLYDSTIAPEARVLHLIYIHVCTYVAPGLDTSHVLCVEAWKAQPVGSQLPFQCVCAMPGF